MTFDLFYENFKFKILDKDDENATYDCSFVASISDDFMQNNIPEELVPGNRIALYNKKDSELWVVMMTSVVYNDDLRYDLNMSGSCTFVLFSKSAQYETYESAIGLV